MECTFNSMFDEVVHTIDHLDKLKKDCCKSAIDAAIKDVSNLYSYVDTYELGYNPVSIRKSGDLLLGFRLVGGGDCLDKVKINVMLGGSDYDLTLEKDKFCMAVLDDIIPMLCLIHCDFYLQLKDKTKKVYIECVWCIMKTQFRYRLATISWSLDVQSLYPGQYCVCTSGLFGFVEKENYKRLRDIKWNELEETKKKRKKILSDIYFDNKKEPKKWFCF